MRLCTGCGIPLFFAEQTLCLSCWQFDVDRFVDIWTLGGLNRSQFHQPRIVRIPHAKIP